MRTIYSGQAAIALLGGRDAAFLIRAESPDVRTPRNWEERHRLFAGADDLVELTDVSEAEALKRFERAWRSDRALRHMLILLDRSEEDETRQMAAAWIEECFVDERIEEDLRRTIEQFVRDQLYSAPLPPSADLDRALTVAAESGAKRVGALLEQVRIDQPVIARVRRAWDTIPSGTFETEELKDRFEAAAVRAGTFRSMAEAVTSRSINQASESSGEHFSADSTAMAVWAAALGVAHSIQAAANASSQVVLADRKGNGVAVRGTHDSGHVDVFMSYNSKDQAAAEVIQKSLAATGVRVWLDTELHAGQITPQLNRIFACASAAMILVGKHGLGPWQEAELEALLELRGGDGKELQLVPVALPDANLECLPASVRTNAGVQFEKAVNEELALRRLFKLLTGQDWPHGTYEIHIEVEEIAVTCFAAVPSAGPDCICEPIKGAINEVNNHFNADIRFQCGAEDSVKLYRAIRSAELIVADCRRLEGTDDADPFVLYQVGLAQAIGKPIIVIVDPAGYPEELYPTPHFVHCDEGEGEWTRNLQEELVDRMQWLASHAILQLVAHDSVGITATCSNDHELRPLRIDGIRTVWRTGLAIQQSFREVAKHVHRLSDTVSNLQDDVKAANEEEETPDVTFQRIRSAFHSGLEGKFDAFQKFLDGDGVPLSLESLRGFAQNLSLDRASPQRDLTYDAFRLLKEKTVGQTSRHVRGAAVSFDRAVHKIDRSCQLSQQAAEAFVALRRRLDNGFDPEKSLGELADNVRALEVATQDINEYTVGMMSSLLEAME